MKICEEGRSHVKINNHIFLKNGKKKKKNVGWVKEMGIESQF